MSRALITIFTMGDRNRIIGLARKAPRGTRVEFKSSKRSMAQNDRMWAMLTEFSRQLPWHGEKLRPNDWKMLFLDALRRELRTVPNLDANGFVNLGRSSSDLTKAEMSDLIELMHEFGARHGVEFREDNKKNG